MFTATESVAADYNFVVSPVEAGTVSAAGLLTLADTATGAVSVVATHKTQTSATATCEFTGVTPKPKTVVSVDIQPKLVPELSYGEQVQFTGTVTHDDNSTDNDVLFNVPIGFGQIHGRNGLYTAPSRDIAEPIKVEVWAANSTLVRDSTTIAGIKGA